MNRVSLIVKYKHLRAEERKKIREQNITLMADSGRFDMFEGAIDALVKIDQDNYPWNGRQINNGKAVYPAS